MEGHDGGGSFVQHLLESNFYSSQDGLTALFVTVTVLTYAC